jgi:hypothetical protein
MAIIKSLPVQKRINNFITNVSETAVVYDNEYSTTGESCVIIKSHSDCKLTLNHLTTEQVNIKCLSKTTIIPSIGKIDEEYDEIIADKGACIEFRCIEENWYILSSDGLKQS